MSQTPQSDACTAWTATVAVRVTDADTGDLASAVAGRLAAAETVREADVVEIEGIEPTLAATVATVVATVETDSAVSASALERALADGPGVERVDAVSTTA